MRDYATAYREFSIAELERRVLGQRLDEGLNVAFACCDRWTEGDRVALEFVARDFTKAWVTIFCRCRAWRHWYPSRYPLYPKSHQ